MKNILPRETSIGMDLFMAIVMIGVAYIFVKKVSKNGNDDDEWID